MKVEVKSKKGLRTILSVIVDKKSIQLKMDEKLNELQKEVALKGFRPGKVPPAVIKSQFGKSIYGEVVDKILRDTSSKVIEEKKLKVAGQPKIDLKQFGEEGVADFFETTDGWNCKIFNDRLNPIYPRHVELSPYERSLVDYYLKRAKKK